MLHTLAARPANSVRERRDVARLRHVLHLHREELHHARNVSGYVKDRWNEQQQKLGVSGEAK